MKKFIVVLSTLGLLSCSAEVTTPEEKQNLEETEESTLPTQAEIDAEQRVNLKKGLCDYQRRAERGCLKAVIAASNLQIGDDFYGYGAREINRKMASHLETHPDLDLPLNSNIEFVRKLTMDSFFAGFLLAVEGSNTTYRSYHAGNGNIKVNAMFPGVFNILLVKELEFKIQDKDDDTIGWVCAVLYTRQAVEIEPGIETGFPQPIATFELEVFQESCSGSKRLKPKVGKKVEVEAEETVESTEEESTEEESTEEVVAL